MGIHNVGKQSCRDVSQRGWQVVQYLLLLSYCSIGISLRPVLAESHVLPTTGVKVSPVRSKPLTYQLVQSEDPDLSTGNLETKNGSIELNATEQEFNNNTQIVTANGKVVVKFNKAVLNADRLSVNLTTKLATAEGNISLIRGKQILYGDKFEYNFEADSGTISEARGDISERSQYHGSQYFTHCRWGEKIF
jgi:lipopolysaccharide assembly outer membrane protein LptD (OstA)